MAEAGMRKRWRLAQWRPDQRADADRLAQKLGVTPMLASLLIQRGLDDPPGARAFLDPRLTDLHDPADLPGADAASKRIVQAVREKQPIVIYGDYDVDGVAASAILWHTLTLAGADVHTYTPHRIEEGYGLNSDAIRQLAEQLGDSHATGRPLMITVDCGVTAAAPARLAKELGVDLIITDHHEFDATQAPDTPWIVHPRWPNDHGSTTYPFGELCGAGVAFKLAWQTARALCGSDRLPEAFRELMVDLLSLAALGTVADVVPLLGENRVLVKFGLGRIKQTRFAGLNALIDAARLRDEKIDSMHVGFVLGPRLNACGRMGHAKDAVRLLTDASVEQAKDLAQMLTKENDRRRSVERDILQQAKQMVLDAGYDASDQRAIVLGNENWHPGVLGIVASRLAEAFGRPVVMLNYDGDQAHGSARSVQDVSIHEAFTQCGEHLMTFGGHAMAAGLRLKRDHVEAFRNALVRHINQQLNEDDLAASMDVHLDCGEADLTFDLFEQIASLAPFGRDNPHPILCLRDALIDEPPMLIGQRKDHLRLWFRLNGRRYQAVGFGLGDLADQLARGVRIDAVFEPKLSTWQGRVRAELHIKDLRMAASDQPVAVL